MQGLHGCCGYGSTPAVLPRIGGTGQGSVRNVWARRYLVLVLDIVVVIFFVVDQFIEVVLVFITVDAQGGDLVVSLEELEHCERETIDNTVCTLTMCVNYGGRAEIADAAAAIAADAAAGKLKPGSITEKTIQKYLDEPDLPDVDLFLRSSGEQRISNFLLWQSAYAEFVFMNVLWPDVDRRTLWEAVEEYARRDRRYGGAVDAVANDK